MRSITLQILVFITVLFAVACRKGDLPEAHYFGKVSIEVADLPGTPNVDVYFDGKLLDPLAPSARYTDFVVGAGSKGKLAFYKANTDSLLMDTTVSIAQNTTQKFLLAYSDDAGIKGFLPTESSLISLDSCAIQLINGLSSLITTKPIDIEVIYVDENFNFVPTGDVVKNLSPKSLAQTVIKLPINDANGVPITYGIMIKDSTTGEYLLDSTGANAWLLDTFAGQSYFDKVFNDNTGVILTEKVVL
jgi:hypothetical protein